MSMDDLWVLEWHHESNSVHVQPLNWMTGRNYRSFKANEKPAVRYVPLFVGTRKEVEAEASRIRPVLVERDLA